MIPDFLSSHFAQIFHATDRARRGRLEFDSKSRQEVSFRAAMQPSGEISLSLRDQNNVAGDERAETLVKVLNACRDNLTLASDLRRSSNLR